jgi:hypothetical protein
VLGDSGEDQQVISVSNHNAAILGWSDRVFGNGFD